ncbi:MULTISPECIES: DMT family transporter [Rhizobium]|uniref:EamA family transporter n=1 Tax=Rhizobium wuzhouense TaxID=1986026 RepID=A0ABX5NQX7_9HYPH|nr:MULTISPECIES: DMT family transporter [Rhizobium]PYB73260.1 EamA family transporter [Rhizobium wuzhouense]RKE83965.1 EamA domain-containing membrane protein RarD [Rhizobium sp. AG855]
MTENVDLPAAPANRHTVHAKGREKLLAHAAMLLFAALIAGSFSFGGMAAQHLEAGPLTLWRYLMTMVVMGILTFGILRVPFTTPRRVWRYALLGGLIAIYMLTMFAALEFTSPVQTGAVFTLMPLISAGFALVFIGQRTRPDVLIALVIAALGAIWVIFRADIGAILSFDVGRGELIYFVGVICHGAYVPLIRKFGQGENPVAFGFWVVVFTIPWLLPTGAVPLAETDFAALPGTVWATIAYLSIVTTAITFMLLQYASMRLPAPKVLGYGYLTPTFIILLEGLLGHGWASPAVFLGALVTAAGLLVMGLLRD